MVFDLSKPNEITEIQNQADEAVYYDDVSLAIQVKNAVKKSMNEHADVLASNRGLEEALNEIILDMEFIQFPSLSDARCLALLQEHLSHTFEIQDYDISEKLKRKILFLELPDEQLLFAKKALEAVRESTSVLGNKNITIGGKSVSPAIKAWISDYEAFPTTRANRSNLDELNYISKGPNIGSLNKEERPNLLTLIKTYDALKSYIAAEESVPVRDDPDPTVNETKLDYASLLPGIIEEQNTKTTKVARPVAVETSAPAVTGRAVKPAAKPEPSAPTGFLGEKKPVAPTKPLSVQEMLKRERSLAPGLRFGPQEEEKHEAPPAVDMAAVAKAAEEKRKQQEEEIDHKLEDLKKRVE